MCVCLGEWYVWGGCTYFSPSNLKVLLSLFISFSGYLCVYVCVCLCIVWCHRRGGLTDKEDFSRQRNHQVQKLWSGKGLGVLVLRLPKSPVWVYR